PAQPELLQHVVGRLGGAGERAREDFRVRDDQLLLAGHGIASKAHEDLELLRLDRPWLALNIAGMQTVDKQHARHSFVVSRRPEDLANGAVARAPSRQSHRLELYPGLGFRFPQKLSKVLRIREGIGIDGRAGADVDSENAGLPSPRGRDLR